MKKIVSKFLLELNTMTLEKRVEVNASEEAIEYLVKKGFDDKLGARPLARIIDDEIKKPLSKMILFGDLLDGGRVEVTEPAEEARFGVMARRAAQRKRGAPALGNMRCRTERAIGPATRGLPGACGQRRTGIKRIKPHACGEIVRLDVGAKTVRGPDAGNRV